MNHRILVIDDNAAIHEDIRKILAPPKPTSITLEDEEALLFGDSNAPGPATCFEIDSAHQGQEGLELVRRSLEARRPYALGFVDVRMPPTHTDEGLRAAEEIRERFPDVGILILSQHVEVGIARRLPDSLDQLHVFLVGVVNQNGDLSAHAERAYISYGERQQSRRACIGGVPALFQNSEARRSGRS